MKDHSSPLANRIRKNLRNLKSFLSTEKISCFRVFDWDMPEYPLCVDVYEGRLHVAEYQTKHQLGDEAYQAWIDECIEALMKVFGLARDSIFLKVRRKRQRFEQYEKVDHTANRFEVSEYGLKFLVNLSDYIDTGLFLDHRPLRKKVQSDSKGKHVLNLFCYTGAFSVHAAWGGALTVTSVDLSTTYLNWARDNFKLNGINITRHSFLRADAKQWVKQAPVRLYDIIILDPPTVSKSRTAQSDFDVQEDHSELIQQTMKHLQEDGVLYFSTNYRNFNPDPALQTIFRMQEITHDTIPSDFRNKSIHRCWKIQHPK